MVFAKRVRYTLLYDGNSCFFFSCRFVPLPKSARPERIRSNLDVFDFELDDGDMLKLDSLNRGKEGAVTWNAVDAG